MLQEPLPIRVDREPTRVILSEVLWESGTPHRVAMILPNTIAVSLFTRILLVLCAIYALYALWVMSRYLRMWGAARRAGAPLGMVAIVRMNWRKVDPEEVVKVYGLARQAGLDLTVVQIERHVTQGGRVLRVIEAYRLASTTKIRITWRDLCQRDLAGDDAIQVVQDRIAALEKRVT